MASPYASLPDPSFWRKAVAEREPDDIDPVTDVPFAIAATDRVATAGSCFAQQLSKAMAARGFNYLVAEPGPASAGAIDENYGVFSARYGNIYTTTQLDQLLERAYGLFAPRDDVWVTDGGAFVDPFRPRAQEAGFASVEALRADREAHLAACRRMFETCDVLVFTLGLTECWMADADEAVVPLPPGVAGGPIGGATYGFRNLGTGRLTADLTRFVDRLRVVNPAVRIVLTVSPVSIIATYEKRHVVVSNGYSKAALRVVAEEVAKARDAVSYFPSFEMVQGPGSGGRFLASDRRHVTAQGIERVMEVFARHYLHATPSTMRLPAPAAARTAAGRPTGRKDDADLLALQGIVCEEELLDQ